MPPNEPPPSSERPAQVGSRRAARTDAILHSALEELAQVGYGAMSVEAVATRVGVAKTTVYRRYPTKLELVRAALRQHLEQAFQESPNTGSLRGDLVAIGRDTVRLASSLLGQSLFRTTMLERMEPELERLGRDLEAEREELRKGIAERAIARGELSKAADFTDLVGVLSAALLFKVVIRRELVDELAIARIVDMLLHGISPSASKQKARPRGPGPTEP